MNSACVRGSTLVGRSGALRPAAVLLAEAQAKVEKA